VRWNIAHDELHSRCLQISSTSSHRAKARGSIARRCYKHDIEARQLRVI
jgi:hypothetical protein